MNSVSNLKCLANGLEFSHECLISDLVFSSLRIVFVYCIQKVVHIYLLKLPKISFNAYIYYAHAQCLILSCSKVPAFLNVTDIAGLVKGAAEGQGLGNAFLSHIKACDALFHLTRKTASWNVEFLLFISCRNYVSWLIFFFFFCIHELCNFITPK